MSHSRAEGMVEGKKPNLYVLFLGSKLVLPFGKQNDSSSNT